MSGGLSIPKLSTPADVERLWTKAAPLTADNSSPEFGLDEQCRYVGIVRSPAPADVEQFNSAGGVIDPMPTQLGAFRLYIARPWWPEIWSIGIYGGPSPLSISPLPDVNNPVLTRDDVCDVPACFVADPFMVRDGDTWHMFFEVMNWRAGRGEIALASSGDAIHWRYRQVVLAEPFHLSYPHVFRHQGEWYMVPESYQAGEVRLYQASEFPFHWSRASTLLTGDYLVDSTPFHRDGRSWMFVDASPRREHDTLRLFWADDLRGPWAEHPQSPLIAGDATRARPAGRALDLHGHLIRFAQNCQPAYGTQVRAFEVTELTADSYREHPVGPDPLLAPSGAGWNAAGMHQIDAHELSPGRWIACVDGWRPTVSCRD